jgi:hypothetical protein
MTRQARDIRTLLVLPRKHGTEELRVKLCEIQTSEGPRYYVEMRMYAREDTGVLASTSHSIYIHSHEIDEVINSLEVALEDISRVKYTLRPKKE